MQNTYDPIKVDEDYFPEHEEEQENFYKKLNVLPRNVADILLIPETAETLEKISKEKKLNVAQSKELSRLVRKITVADVYLGDIVKEIQNRLSVSENSAREIANSLIKEVFAPALEDIKKMHVEKFGRPNANIDSSKISEPSSSFVPKVGLDKPDIVSGPKRDGQTTSGLENFNRQDNFGIGTTNPNNTVNLKK